MIAPALTYEATPTNTALKSTDMALRFLRRITAEHAASVRKVAQERLVANEKTAVIREQQREERRRAIRQDTLARTHKRARETARAVSRDLHCRHDARLAIERWLLFLVSYCLTPRRDYHPLAVADNAYLAGRDPQEPANKIEIN